jgi:hypothetical protein
MRCLVAFLFDSIRPKYRLIRTLVTEPGSPIAVSATSIMYASGLRPGLLRTIVGYPFRVAIGSPRLAIGIGCRDDYELVWIREVPAPQTPRKPREGDDEI